MRIAIGCDHRGLNLKKAITELLSQTGHSYEDFGCYDAGSVDYPDIGSSGGGRGAFCPRHPDL